MSLPKNELTDELFRSILLLKNADECYQYFEDLCTVSEIQALGQRLEVAKLLSSGYSYQHTVDKTGVSSATIGRVNRCIKYGTGGYALILGRMGEKKDGE